ncbi:hypothetical protein Tco_1361039 [Tanacetum coccineum]
MQKGSGERVIIQSIQTFLTDRKNLATVARGKKKTAHLLILSVRFTKLIIHHLRTKHNIHPRIGSPLHYLHEESILNTLKFVGKMAPKPTATQPPKPKPAPTQPSKAVSEKKRKLVKETPDEPSPAKRSKGGLVGKDQAKSHSILDDNPVMKGPARPVVLREPDSEKYQPLLEVQGKGKEKFVDEQAAHDLLTLHIPTKKSLNQMRKSPNPGIQDEGQTGSNPDDAAESQPQPSYGVHARPNREHMDLEATDASSQQKPEQMDEDSTGTLSSLQNLDKDLSFTDQFFMEKPHEEESGKTNAETEVRSIVSVPIHQDTSSVPPMTTSVIDLMTMQSDSPLPTSTATTSIITTTTSLPPPPQL